MSQYNRNNANKKAVALKYENDEIAPVIVAAGLGYMAEKIIEVASENRVPVFEDTSLATVLSQLELGTAVPEELYKAIVDIYVYFLNFNNKNITENIKNLAPENEKTEEIDIKVEPKNEDEVVISATDS